MTGTAIFRPPHAHVPGRNQRHPDGTFDRIRQTASAGMSVGALADSAAVQHGLAYLDSSLYWEAHEVLEPVWMALPDGSAEKLFVQGLIQLANACLKLEMGRPKAALRLCTISLDLIGAERGDGLPGVPRQTYVDKITALENSIKLQYNA